MIISNIKHYLNKQSIIQLTLLRITFSIFSFLLVFLLIYGQDYWKKETLDTNYKLLSVASHARSRVQSRTAQITMADTDESLTLTQKISEIETIILPIYDEAPNTFVVGYYDSKLDSIITKHTLTPDTRAQILSLMSADNTLQTFILNNKSLSLISLPIYMNDNLVGYTWAYTDDAFSLFESYRKMSLILILTLALSALIIWTVRKYIKQIGLFLDKFSKIMIQNESEVDEDEVLGKLPELKPVLHKISSFTDELKRINFELELSELKMAKILEGISDGFFSLDRNWQFTFVNNETQKTQTKNLQLLGRNIWEVFPEAVGSPTYDKLQEAMFQNESLHWQTNSFPLPDHVYSFHAYPFYEGLTVFFRDITEFAQQREELARLEKLNLIGQLAAGISHEIRNPLTTVKGFLQLLQSQAEYIKVGEYLDLMISEIDRANAIITDFLSLAKANLDNTKHICINYIISKLFPILQADAYSNNKEILLELNDLPNIMLNENEIKQLILNLVRNGLEVTPEHGHVVIRTYKTTEHAVLAISDQGSGIPEDIQEKIGIPFFTTKETGTGLGLAISMGIAQRHKANFHFETGNTGSTFYISFPIT